MIRSSKLWILPILFSSAFLQAQDQHGRTVWQIGKFDHSPVEFASHSTQTATFRVGTDEAHEKWPASQMTGSEYRVLFSLPSVQGAYHLRIDALIEKPRVPNLQITLNGTPGTFFPHPKLSYSRSDFSYAFDPHEADSSLNIEISAALLRTGENILTIRCIDDPATPTGGEELGGISYDALSLQQEAAGDSAATTSKIVVEPTIFFQKTPNGLAEMVDAFVRFSSAMHGGTLVLHAGGRAYRAPLSNASFGEQKFSFALPEWSGTLNGKVGLEGSAAEERIKLVAQRKWNIFVVPHTHLDVGFTDYQGKVAETQARVLSQADALIREHPDFRFSMDGSWNLQQLLETRPQAKRDEVLELIRAGKMAMPAQYCNLLTGYASLETLYRSLYDSKGIATRNGLPFEYANITDVPTYSGSYPSVLASAGVKYWVAAANNDRAPIFSYSHWNEKSPFWWEGPDGKRVLFWYSRHYEQVQTLFGLPPQLAAVRESLPIYLQAYAQPSYKPDAALLYGTQVENTDLVPATATFADEWNKQYAFPKLTYATFPDFFHYLDSHYAHDLPTFKGDGGGYWEDGIGSDAYFAAEDRQNQNRALSAEVLSSLTHSVDPNLNPPAGLLADIWHNIILFSEHTWLSYNSVSQPDHEQSIRQLRVKDDRPNRASLEIDDLMNRSLSQLADQIHVPADTLVVFNSLGWRRDGLIETDLPENRHLLDLTTQKEVPLEILSQKQKFVHVRFLAEDLPAVGYKCFRIAHGTQSSSQPRPSNRKAVENSYYRVTLDPGSGSIAQIYDKQLQRDIVDSYSPYRFGQYLYVTGGDGDTQMINPFPALPPGELTIHPSSNGRVLSLQEMPWGQSIRLASADVNTPSIQTEVLLFNREKKMELRYRVHKSSTTRKEAVYFAFPTAVAGRDFIFANQQGWVDPARDLMNGGSLEWFNVQQCMAARGPGLTVGIVPLDSSLASFGDINRGRWPGVFQPKTSTIFSYVMNNYWHTNYRADQGGDFTFRYSITSAEQFDGGALSHLGLAEMRPLELDTVVSQDKMGDPQRPLPAAGEGFLETNPSVALITWKAAEDRKGMILRLQELAGRPTTQVVHFPRLTLASAHLCSGVEENAQELAVHDNAVQLEFKPFEVLTLRVTSR